MKKPASRPFPLVSMLALQCPLTKIGGVIFANIHQTTKGDPCTTGCAHFKKGKCDFYQRLVTASPSEGDLKKALTMRLVTFILAAELALGVDGGFITAALFRLYTDPLKLDEEAVWNGIQRDFPGADGDHFDFDALCVKIGSMVKEMS